MIQELDYLFLCPGALYSGRKKYKSRNKYKS